jgi:hypothetical protein
MGTPAASQVVSAQTRVVTLEKWWLVSAVDLVEDMAREERNNEKGGW